MSTFATAQQLTDTENMIRSVLNVTAAWGDALNDPRRQAEVITKSRVYATMEVVKAIARNPRHGYWAAYARDTRVRSGDYLPAYWGMPGVPQISVSDNDEDRVRDGVPGSGSDIDAWRADASRPRQFRLYDETAHDELDRNGMMSPYAGFFELLNNRIKYTGGDCIIPLVIFNEEDVATKTPVFALPTIVKLSPFFNLKEGDNLGGIAQSYYQAGMADLQAIESGATSVPAAADTSPPQQQDQ